MNIIKHTAIAMDTISAPTLLHFPPFSHSPQRCTY